ncbi:MAG: hypothetical protein IKU17_02160 [Clostridia bacterium]|nr:hypothetical protein [Clostridia bacterium]
MAACLQCGRALTADETAVYRKLVNRQAEKFMCKTCLAAYFEVSEAKIDQKIEQFKRSGCLLFVQEKN